MKRFARAWILHSFFLSAFLPAAAQEIKYTTLLIPYPLEDINRSPRALAMGSAFTAAEGDASCLMSNPAGLAGLESASLSLTHQSWIAEISQESFLVALPFPKAGTAALAVHFVNFNTLEGYDGSGFSTTSYNPLRLSFSLGWGLPLSPSISAGLSAKGLYQSLFQGESALASSYSAGLLWGILPSLKAGASYSFLYTDASPEMGLLKFGTAWTPSLGLEEPVLLHMDLSMPPQGVYRLQLGAEQRFFSLLAFRVGHQWEWRDNRIEGFRGFTYGMGIRFQDLELDYAFAPDGDMGASHTAGLSYVFHPEKPRPTSTPTSIPIPTRTTTATFTATPVPELIYAPSQARASTPVLSPTFTLSPTPVFSPKVASTPSRTPTPLPSPGTALNFRPPSEISKDDKAIQVEMKFDLSKPASGNAAAPSAETQKRIEELGRIVEKDPGNSKAWGEMGRLYWQTGQSDFAVQCFEEVLRLQPENQAVKTWLERHRGRTPAGVPANTE